MNAEQSQLPSGVRCASPVWYAPRNRVPVISRKSLFGKEKLGNFRSLPRLCAGLVALVATLGVSLPAAAEPVETTGQTVDLRTIHAPRDLTAMVQGPTRIALSWQAPESAGTSAITGYGIEFSNDGGANWSVLPSTGRQTTSFVHTVGLRPNAKVLYRVFSLGGEGAGPAALVSATTPAIAMPQIVDVSLSTDQGTTRWYPPRREVVVTVQFDQAVTVNTKYGAPRIDLEMGRPPHRQSGYLSEYSGGSGTDRLTFRYSGRGLEPGPQRHPRSAATHCAGHGARVTNVGATHSASLAHGSAILESTPQVDARSDTVLVMESSRQRHRRRQLPVSDLQMARKEQAAGVARPWRRCSSERPAPWSPEPGSCRNWRSPRDST